MAKMREHTFEIVQDDTVVGSATSADRRDAFDAAMFRAWTLSDISPVTVRERGRLFKEGERDVIVTTERGGA